MGTERKIITTLVYPPIPVRDFDYCATREGWDLGEPQGWGETPEAAIADLIDLEEWNEAADFLREAVRLGMSLASPQPASETPKFLSSYPDSFAA